MSHHREILSALQKLKSGAAKLTTEQYVGVLEAVEQAAEALHAAPRGHDPVASSLWWNHERTPAIARLADALSWHEPVAPLGASAEQLVVRLEAAVGGSTPPVAKPAQGAHAQLNLVESAPAPTSPPAEAPHEEGKHSTKPRPGKNGEEPTDAEIARALYNALLEHTKQ